MEAAMIESIHPSQIESALTDLWQKHKDTNTIRASLFNLVIYTKNDFREEYLQKIGRNIIKKFPCRMIMIKDNEKPGEDFLKTSVTDITPDSKENTIFCDIIHFEAAGSSREKLPFLVLPHLLPDLPVYLLWGDDPSKTNPIALKLENYASRTIFDSETAVHLTDFAKTILQLHKEVFCEIGDLNWARCAPWRTLFSYSFNCPNRIDILQRTKSLHITYNTTETKHFSHNKIQAIYFQAWLATCLGWSFETALGTRHELSFKYHFKNGPIMVTLTPTKREGVLPGRIVSVDVISMQHDHFLFERDLDMPSHVHIRYTSSLHCDIPTKNHFDPELSGKSIIQEIYSSGTSPNLIKVLELIAKYPEEVISS